jgi:formylglycine-generating enzyme required for sulfatase activity
LIGKIHEAIIKREKDASDEPGKNYREKIASTEVEFDMVAIPGGVFSMGANDDDAEAGDEEKPAVEVAISPFWIGRCEVTWDEYEPFMVTAVDRAKHGARIDFDANVNSVVDGISQPTPPYTEMSFGMGQSGFPAISMTQHAANKYCQWLSAQTGHFYRLPTEAEWEYACRAGTTTPYSCGDESLDDYAWYYDNAEDKYQKVGTKKPNPWGLFDMHGNVAEWVADAFVDEYHERLKVRGSDPLIIPETLYPRSVRGGSWDDDPEMLRSSARRGSDPSWKDQDPQLPRSIWYHTDAQWLGFRVVRPLSVPDAATMSAHWNSATGFSD